MTFGRFSSILESYGAITSSPVASEESDKKKVLNNPRILSRSGRGKIMIFEKNKQLITHKFGELELVDRSLFFICANRRDN
jgi:hypothetical protein